MKRSQSIVLTTLMAGTGLSLSACDADVSKPVDALSYTSVSECRTAGKIPADQCEAAYAQAQKANEQNAPRFNERQSCEEQYGVAQCVPRNNGSFFTPLLTGFVVGQLLNGGGGYRGAPMYRDRDGSYFGGAGNRISRDYVTGRTQVGSDAFNSSARAPARVQSRSAVISRSGFGGGFGHGGFGG
ncbi:DUF1190 domain-containing protein [Sphingomonas sp. PAMC 26605]|uniref:DUF1190 domain-containing protein n=1 Tax=Sphingomonas sp. PAMC 26605 TaxID=1112214 RepID=UPI00026CB5FA|nr:DUF1190 domain-containing protein [Sphingomonas sp. PAMC 26605]